MHSRLLQSITLVILFTLLLSACNLPTTAQPAAETPSIGLLETAVAATLTSAPSSTPLPDTPTAPAPTAEPPTATIETLQMTETPTLTPTPIIDDPAVALGNPTGRDTLDSGGGFGLNSTYEDDYTKLQISNGAMVMTSRATNGWRGWRVRPPKISNFYLEGTYVVQSCSGGDFYGLVFRSQSFDSGQGYYFGITCDGRYGLSKWESGGSSSIVTLNSSDRILVGVGQTNRLGVMAQGGHLKLYINGNLVQELDDNAFKDGYYGSFIAGSSGGLTVNLDTIQYWSLP